MDTGFEVLIAGAIPTGLLLAEELRLAGRARGGRIEPAPRAPARRSIWKCLGRSGRKQEEQQ
ncbi:hypothetical protein GCM10023191_008680 [Actinoallomurus oryzae]|uniref:FAD-binding domain-containing protein n=1 Tax=Actinoallomurus oryzae TaxID=502180 RepID=A0ABP8PEG6_9ACTN